MSRSEAAERVADKEERGRTKEGGSRRETDSKGGAPEGYSGYPSSGYQAQGYYPQGWDYQAYYAYHTASAGGFRDYAVEKPDAYRAFLQYVRSGPEGAEVVLADKMCLDRHVADLLMCLESWLWRENGPPAVSGQPWRLGKLDLARNDLSDESVVRIAERLKQLDIRVKRLDLDSNMATARSVGSLTEYVWNCQEPLSELGLAKNAIDVDGAIEGDDAVSALLRCLFNHPGYPLKSVEVTSEGEDIQVTPLTIRLSGNNIANAERLLERIKEKGGASHIRVCNTASSFRGNGEEFLAVFLPNIEEQGSGAPRAGFSWAQPLEDAEPAPALEDAKVDAAGAGGAAEPAETTQAKRVADRNAQATIAPPASTKASKKTTEDGAPKKKVKKVAASAAQDSKTADPTKEGKPKVKRKTSAASTPKASPVLASGEAGAVSSIARPPPLARPAATPAAEKAPADGKAVEKAADGKAAPTRKKVVKRVKVKKVKVSAEGAEPGAAAKPATVRKVVSSDGAKTATKKPGAPAGSAKAGARKGVAGGAAGAAEAESPDDIEADTFGEEVNDVKTEEKTALEKEVSGCLAQTPGLDPEDKETRAELSEFVVTMLIARKRPSEVHRELEGFLKDETSGFVSWLIEYLKGPWARARKARSGATPKATAGRSTPAPAAV